MIWPLAVTGPQHWQLRYAAAENLEVVEGQMALEVPKFFLETNLRILATPIHIGTTIQRSAETTMTCRSDERKKGR